MNKRLEKRVRIKNILFLTDFSWASRSAVPFVREIAREYESKVTALHVTVPDVLTYLTPDPPSAVLERQHDLALAEMKKVESSTLRDFPSSAGHGWEKRVGRH